MRYKVVTPVAPADESLGLVEMRAHLGLVAFGGPPAVHPHDALLLTYGAAARDYAEQYCNRAFAKQVWEVAYEEFPDVIELPGGVATVVSVTYKDITTGVDTVLAPGGYFVDDFALPYTLIPIYQGQWPAHRVYQNSVRVRVSVGNDPLPASVRAAMLLMVGQLYENREEASQVQTYRLPTGIKALLDPYRLGMGV